MNILLAVLAQCSCGGGGEVRISYGAALVPIAAVVLCAFVYDAYARKKARGTSSREHAEPEPSEPHDED